MQNQQFKSVLFLCTGNYYRSRFAEVYFNWHAHEMGLEWNAFSRGLALVPSNPGPMSHYTVQRLKVLGIPIDKYQRLPQDVTANDFAAAHHIVAVKGGEHRPLMQSRFPAWVECVEFWEVHDLDCAGPEETMSHLEREVLALIDRLHDARIQKPQSGSNGR